MNIEATAVYLDRLTGDEQIRLLGMLSNRTLDRLAVLSGAELLDRDVTETEKLTGMCAPSTFAIRG